MVRSLWAINSFNVSVGTCWKGWCKHRVNSELLIPQGELQLHHWRMGTVFQESLHILRTRVSHLVHRNKTWFLLTNHPSLVDMWLTTDFFLGHFWRDKQFTTMGKKKILNYQQDRNTGNPILKMMREYCYKTFCYIKFNLNWL